MKKITAVALLAISACATHTGVVDVGGGKYMIARQAATGLSGMGNLKADIVLEARAHCALLNQDLNVLAMRETEPPYILGNYPRAEIVFSCGKPPPPPRTPAATEV